MGARMQRTIFCAGVGVAAGSGGFIAALVVLAACEMSGIYGSTAWFLSGASYAFAFSAIDRRLDP